MTFFWLMVAIGCSMLAINIIALMQRNELEEKLRLDLLTLLDANYKLKKALVDARHSLKIIREWDDDSEYEWEDPGVCAADGIKKINEALREI